MGEDMVCGLSDENKVDELLDMYDPMILGLVCNQRCRQIILKNLTSYKSSTHNNLLSADKSCGNYEKVNTLIHIVPMETFELHPVQNLGMPLFR